MFSWVKINDKPAWRFIIRCCLFNHFIIHISWYTLPYLWIVVFTTCNTDLSLFSQASCRKESRCKWAKLSVWLQHYLCPWVHLIEGNGFWIIVNMLILSPHILLFIHGQRIDRVWSRLYAAVWFSPANCWSAYLALYTHWMSGLSVWSL